VEINPAIGIQLSVFKSQIRENKAAPFGDAAG
jgi:hypothetical protein